MNQRKRRRPLKTERAMRYRKMAICTVVWVVSAAVQLGAIAPSGQERPQGGQQVLAEGNGFKLTRDDLRQILRSLPETTRQQLADPKQEAEFVRRWIEAMVQGRAAKELRLEEDPKYKPQMEMRRTQALAEAYRAKVMDDVRVEEKDLQAFYERNKEAFLHPKVVRLRRIVVSSQRSAADVAARARKGESFAELALRYSKEPESRDRGGMLGWVQAGQLEPSVEQLAFSMDIGAVGGPVPTRKGWQILYLEDKREPGYYRIDDVRERLEPELLELRRQQAVQEATRKLLDEWKVKIHVQGGGKAAGGKAASKGGG